MTFKCTLVRSTVYSHWTCTRSTAAQLSADVARCAATCDVDKLLNTDDIWQSGGREKNNRHRPLTVLDMS